LVDTGWVAKQCLVVHPLIFRQGLDKSGKTPYLCSPKSRESVDEKTAQATDHQPIVQQVENKVKKIFSKTLDKQK
jgi:hypothetical protein